MAADYVDGGVGGLGAILAVVGVHFNLQSRVAVGGQVDVEVGTVVNSLSCGAGEDGGVGAVRHIVQFGNATGKVNAESTVNLRVGGDGNSADIGVGLGEMQFQHTAEIFERKLIVCTLCIHGELIDRTRNVGLCDWECNIRAVSGQCGRIEGAERAVACLTAHIIEYSHCGGALRRGGVDAASTISAVDGNLVAFHPVESSAVEDGLTALVGAALHRCAELGAVAHLLLLAGGKGQ